MKLLAEVVEHFDGPEISIEGYNFTQYDFQNVGDVEFDKPLPSLEKNIISPPSNFVVIRPGREAKVRLVEWLSKLGTHEENIVHVQINVDGMRVFQAHDHFDQAGVYLIEHAAEEMVPRLLKRRIIRGSFFPDRC